MSKNNINGILLLNKPLGLSSNTALQKAKRIFNAAKAGHTGTLDPLATGLLPICFGEATKFSSFLLDGDKEYIAIIKLGQATTTYDAEGEITSSGVAAFDSDTIVACLSDFRGEIWQTPPIYSALKVNGKALYQYARSGEEVIIKSRQISIHQLELEEMISSDTIRIRVLCSKGTYIRTLAHDIGLKLGCGAHLVGLVRTKTNQFMLDERITLEHLSHLTLDECLQYLLPTDAMLLHCPIYNLTDSEFCYIKNGHEFEASTPLMIFGLMRLYYKNKFLGIANNDGNMVKPQRLMNTTSMSSSVF